MYDIAIIGLGPAGAALARLLNPRLRVIALDKKSTQGNEGFHKPCGGLLAPDAQKALARMNLTLPHSVLANPQIFSVRTIDTASGQERLYDRNYLNIDRHKFDLWLKSTIPAHIEICHDATCTGISRETDGFHVSYQQNAQEHHIIAKMLVGADGADSLVRKLFCKPTRIRTYIAIQQWFKDTHLVPFYACVFDQTTTDCYAWGLTKDEYFIFGGAFPLKNARACFEALKGKLTNYGFCLNDPIKTEGCLVLRPRGLRDFRVGQDGVFLVGEAAGFISPSSLEGISHAFESAHKLSRVLNSGGTNRQYFFKTVSIRFTLVLKNMKGLFMYVPFLRRLVMRSGLTAFHLFDGQEQK